MGLKIKKASELLEGDVIAIKNPEDYDKIIELLSEEGFVWCTGETIKNRLYNPIYPFYFKINPSKSISWGNKLTPTCSIIEESILPTKTVEQLTDEDVLRVTTEEERDFAVKELIKFGYFVRPTGERLESIRREELPHLIYFNVENKSAGWQADWDKMRKGNVKLIPSLRKYFHVKSVDELEEGDNIIVTDDSSRKVICRTLREEGYEWLSGMKMEDYIPKWDFTYYFKVNSGKLISVIPSADSHVLLISPVIDHFSKLKSYSEPSKRCRKESVNPYSEVCLTVEEADKIPILRTKKKKTQFIKLNRTKPIIK